MLFRAIVAALILAAPPLPAPAIPPAVAQAEAAMSTEELMRATALDQLFNSFGETIASSPDAQGVPLPANFLGAWKETASEVFEANQLHGELATALEGKFSDAELMELASFFRSTFGARITALESGVQQLSTEEQLAARDEGISILEDLPTGARRDTQIDEILELVSAEIGRAMLGQAMRAMMVSMALSGGNGDIEVPWDEIDAQVAGMLPGLEREVAATQRAIMAYAYKDLTDDEVETYLQFLRTEASKKFYAVVGYSVGTIMERAMSRFGEQLARRLNQVNV